MVRRARQRENDAFYQTNQCSRCALTGLPTSKPVVYEAGNTIFSYGDECTAVHYVNESGVKLTLVSKRGKVAELGFLGRGDFFGKTAPTARISIRHPQLPSC